MTQPPDDDARTPRRRFLGHTATLVGAGLGAAMAVPVLGHLGAPLLSDDGAAETGWRPLGPAAGFPIGEAVRVPVVATRRDAWQTDREAVVGSVWVVRSAVTEVQVFSTVCPHLGCAIARDDHGFHCPCHNSQFDKRGGRLNDEGPSPRDMDSLEAEVREGVLWCRFQRFASGVAEKTATA